MKEKKETRTELPGAWTMHPMLLFVWLLKQSVDRTVPVSNDVDEAWSGCVHPSSVCKLTLLNG